MPSNTKTMYGKEKEAECSSCYNSRQTKKTEIEKAYNHLYKNGPWADWSRPPAQTEKLKDFCMLQPLSQSLASWSMLVR